MNRTKIEWTDYSWNPITGCENGCWYCYARKMFKRFHKSFKPTFHQERLQELAKLKKPSKIFVCSVSDLFASWTKKSWRNAVLKTIEECPVKHTFQLLTKQPQLIDKYYQFPDNYSKRNKKGKVVKAYYYYCFASYNDIIFSHDFAKSFWKRDKDCLLPEGKNWRYHLQQLVLEDEPLKYLERFLK